MNKIRGEAELVAAGKSYRLLLTLGALAEIEDGLALTNLSEIGARLKQMRASDLAVVAAALLRGGGHEMTPADVLRLPSSLGDIARAVADAFVAADLPSEGRSSSEARESVGGRVGEGGENTTAPFAGSACSPSVSAG